MMGVKGKERKGTGREGAGRDKAVSMWKSDERNKFKLFEAGLCYWVADRNQFRHKGTKFLFQSTKFL